MRLPERMVGGQGQAVPGQMLQARVFGAGVPIDPVLESGILELREPPGGVARGGIGRVDHARAPVARAAVGPAVALDDGVELRAEPIDALAVGDRTIDGARQGRE